MAIFECWIWLKVSSWLFQLDSGGNRVAFVPHMMAKAPSSATTSGGLALASSASHAAAPAGRSVMPRLHQSFWPKPCTPAEFALENEFMAADQAASVGYLGVGEYPAPEGKVTQLSACTPSATQG